MVGSRSKSGGSGFQTLGTARRP